MENTTFVILGGRMFEVAEKRSADIYCLPRHDRMIDSIVYYQRHEWSPVTLTDTIYRLCAYCGTAQKVLSSV